MKTLLKVFFTGLIVTAINISFVHAATSTPLERNEKLLGFNEAYEVLTEKALTDDVSSIKSAWKDAKDQKKDIESLLDTAGVKKFGDLMDTASQANKQKKWVDLSLASAEIYKFVVLACDSSILDVPVSVHILDYVGFKNKAYLKMADINWVLIASNVEEGRVEWEKIKNQVTDKDLLKSMSEAIDGMIKASKEKDVTSLKSTTETELSLVDELETNLSKKNHSNAAEKSDSSLGKIYTAAETADFISVLKETMAALAAKDKKLMVMKLTDLEAMWDGNEDQLKPRNEAQWKLIDATLDRGINSLRSTSYDEVKGKQALEDLLKALTESTK